MQVPVGNPSTNVLDLLLDAVCVVDVEGRFLFVSAAFERIFGYTPAEMIGRPMLELVHPDDRERTLRAATEIMAGQSKPHFQNRYLRKDGKTIHVMWSARWSEADQARIAVARDITELKRAESMQAALHAISDAANTTDDLPALLQRVHQIIGEQLPARRCCVALRDPASDTISHPYCGGEDATAHLQHPLQEVIAGALARDGQAGDAQQAATHAGSSDGTWIGVPLVSHAGSVVGALVVQGDDDAPPYSDEDALLLQFVSTQIAAAIERKQAQARLQYLARHDPLTDLPNRELFRERLHAALVNARRSGGRLALLYLDLDRFKQLNDNLGHAFGDAVLRETANRVRRCVRESDTVGRMGGDEFVLLLGNCGQPGHALAVADKIRAALALPFDIEGHRVVVAASIGITMFPDHGDDESALLRQADDAMYVAKKQGGNRSSLAVLAEATATTDSMPRPEPQPQPA